MERDARLEPAEIEMFYLAENPAVVQGGPTSLSKQASIAQAFLQTFEKYAPRRVIYYVRYADDPVRREVRYVHGARAPTAGRRAVSLSP
jgi:hypothetical protein